MGDTVEITPQQGHPPAYYRVSSGAISIELKGTSGSIGLVQSLEKICQCFIIFSLENVKIRGPEGVKCSGSGLYTLSNIQYKRFWVAWDGKLLIVGMDRRYSQTILSYPMAADLNYIVFYNNMSHTVCWRFESPPAPLVRISRSIPYKAVSGGQLRWVKAMDQVPDDAVVGGFEGECLYIVRGHHRRSLTPGKFVPSEGTAYVPWGGATNDVSEFEILVGYNFKWVPTSLNRIPNDAFVAGYSEINNEKLYIGRAKTMNCLIPGKVQPSHKVCYIPFDGKEQGFKEYEILTVPESNPYPEDNMWKNGDFKMRLEEGANVEDEDYDYYGAGHYETDNSD